ncbi:hypothetical protein BT96DRAFT_965647 [Gymnopus androsaceus JB14]|uniref:Uncharacterized protein n=1 Tax=Gymnopus androsaceus JB14 TaxID=1447944 RepID=A0A6A4HQQ8_9AGAR|nr:hypothetical protein BT96DRAFT_965647 [Gymnopus androsaceus JB14]
MLDAFKLKPLDLEPIYASWKDAPMFYGESSKNTKNTKKDLPVDEWLEKIKEGCVERNVPKEYWHKVAQRYMGEKARARLNELKAVMAKVHGGNYRWNWEKFKIAMRNMGWNVEASETETIKVQTKPSGLWWMTRHNSRKSEDSSSSETLCDSPTEETPPADVKGGGPFWISRRPTVESIDKKEDKPEKSIPLRAETRTHPKRSASTSTLTLQWPVRRGSKDESAYKHDSAAKDSSICREDSISSSMPRPSPQKTVSDSVLTSAARSPTASALIPGQVEANGETVTTITHAPVWLLNACNAMEFLSTEHPKVMSTLSAILITAGTIPSIPAISAGAGGALLASGAAQAVGAIALGVGSWLKAAQHETQAGAGGNGPERSTTV